MMSDTKVPTAGFRAGYVAIVGCPNVGKSTLMNRLIGAKISITSKKAQTTRHRIHGILTTDACQYVFVDTPGIQMRHRNALNRAMNRAVSGALADIDVILFVIEANRWRNEDRAVLTRLPADIPVVLVISKIDRMTDKNALLPFMAMLAEQHAFSEIVPTSAERGDNLDTLLQVAARYLPEAAPIFDSDDQTDRSERFLAAELLREKLFRNLGEELPYGIAVEIERFEIEEGVRRIHAAIIVERDAHKAMVIGKGGERMKRVASDARKDMERLFGGKVWLETWVKVKGGWADDERALKSLGYE
ncbi:MAG: GTPase Era [Gammaproteobacteria bacterium]|nr:GTPase Era [Rhodocyclaceae bacterium]MBU3907905.1 GTPase Era [Gammaproteobacteria bacterium]MBU3988265.1 GTPase Era [Gammaproteobacteria bacterium]MBU4003811.1 GTPase Era [Gammaproteobacteria bacterium]MBU4021689.1 GTPase Era [Gammaproteobacteria bacterium]